MGAFIRPIIRPLIRLFVGIIAIPLFRLFLRKGIRLQDLDAELEKDLEQWFQGSLVLLVATKNMEDQMLTLMSLGADGDPTGEMKYLFMGLRIMLAIGVIGFMPDQELFSVIHPGPPRLKFSSFTDLIREFRENFRAIWVGYLCRHLNQSSPVFAILAAMADGWVGWFCYGMAIVQYLIIGLVTSKDKALDVLSEFDRQVAIRRRELVEEFEIGASPGSSTETVSLRSDNISTVEPVTPASVQTERADVGDVANRPEDGYES